VTARFDLITFDSPATDALAVFWSSALELVESEREDGDRWIVLSDSLDVRRIGIQRGATRAGSVHLDLSCGVEEFASELARFDALGAELVAPVRIESYGSIANLRDPDGNPFDLCAYQGP
jgi:predicted enzyme related to lactoylglutathione lyase